MQKSKHFKVAGVFIIIGLILNKWVLESVFSPDDSITNPFRIFLIVSFQFILILYGIALLLNNKPALKIHQSLILKNTLLIVFAMIFTFVSIELFLKTGLLHDINDPAPVWIPRKLKKIEYEINAANELIARKNPHFFNDSIRSQVKPKGKKRIAIQSDSFIWGDAVPYDNIWSHIFEKKILQTYPDIEVLSWGRNNLSTQRELHFFRDHGVKYGIDFLIIGFTSNDPDIQKVERKRFTWHASQPAEIFGIFFPNILDFFSSHLNNFLIRYFLKDYSYAKWEDKLYSKENLSEYQNTLNQFSEFCRTNKIGLLFVLTPTNNNPNYGEKFTAVSPYFTKSGIPYLNLFPMVEKKFKGVNPRKLWATPGNGHPGIELTELFAEEVFQYFLNRNLLEKLMKQETEEYP